MFRLFSYFRYFLYCVNEHSLHSPLVYDLYLKVIKPSKKWKSDLEIEKLRFSLSKSSEEIEVTDYGTGRDRAPIRRVSEILKTAASSPSKSILIKSIAEYFESKRILELGTSMGINTLYLSTVSESEVITFEGSESIADIAQQQFDVRGKSNINLIRGNIDETLPYFLARSEKLDFVFIDANHDYEPTMEYYLLCQHRSHDESVFVIDDIHQSPGMEKAWHEIINRVEVLMSIDLYSLGIVIFDPSLAKQNYVLEY